MGVGHGSTWLALKVEGGAMSQACGWPLEAGKRKETIFPRGSVKEHSPADDLILGRRNPFWTSDLKNRKLRYLHGLSHHICDDLLQQTKETMTRVTVGKSLGSEARRRWVSILVLS